MAQMVAAGGWTRACEESLDHSSLHHRRPYSKSSCPCHSRDFSCARTRQLRKLPLPAETFRLMTTRSDGIARDSRPRVLIVDDYPGLVSAWRRWLQLSYDIVGGVSDSGQVLKTAAELKPDVIVLDVLMPGTNGLDLCRDIRRTAPETKVVLVSAADEEHVLSTALRLGASAFILKSSEPQELDRAIQHALRGETYFPRLVRRYRLRN